nr:hypothetical protein [candidate division KSB1 bacterium]
LAHTIKKKNQASKTLTISSNKYDIWLNKQLKNAENEDFIHFSVICQHELSIRERREVEKTGVKINTLTGTIFTAQATKKQINQLAGLAFIKYLKGSKPVKLKNMNE